VLARQGFAHSDEDWLVLGDLAGIDRSEFEARRDDLAQLLGPFWNADWFSSVFVQDAYFRWQAMFGRGGVELLPAWRA